jgi:hypothetical protein
MKHRFGNGNCRDTAALSAEGFASSSGDKAGARLRRALARAGEPEQVLATRNREVEAAWNVVRNLREINSRLTEDLAQVHQKEEQARALAYHDELTGLPNRRLLWNRLHQALAHGMRHDKQVALLLRDEPFGDPAGLNNDGSTAAGTRLYPFGCQRATRCSTGQYGVVLCRQQGSIVSLNQHAAHLRRGVAAATHLVWQDHRCRLTLPQLCFPAGVRDERF